MSGPILYHFPLFMDLMANGAASVFPVMLKKQLAAVPRRKV